MNLIAHYASPARNGEKTSKPTKQANCPLTCRTAYPVRADEVSALPRGRPAPINKTTKP